MGRGVLDGSTSRFVMGVIDVAIGWPKRGKMLPRGDSDLMQVPDLAIGQPPAYILRGRVMPQHVRNLHGFARQYFLQPLGVLQPRTKRLFDKQRAGRFRRLGSMFDVHIRRSADHNAGPRLLRRLGEGLENVFHSILLGDLPASVGIGLAQGNRAADLLETTQMPLANRSASDNEHVYRHVQPPSTIRLAPVM